MLNTVSMGTTNYFPLRKEKKIYKKLNTNIYVYQTAWKIMLNYLYQMVNIILIQNW